MERYLIDNNTISFYFSGSLSNNGLSFISKVIDQTPNISVITEIEALSWINPDKSKELIIRSFIEDSNILPLSKEIVMEWVKIRRTQKIKTPDAIIAATAMVHEMTLISGDAIFSNIQGLEFINPIHL